MKPFFTLLIALVAAATASAGSVITAVNNGTWANASTWNLNRLPQSGDTIVIPAGLSLAFTNNTNLNGVLVKIWGALHMSGSSKLDLDNAGVINVYNGGTITGAGNGDQIKIGNTIVFKGNDPDVVGPMFADNTTGGGFAPLSILPVTFANFYVSRTNDDILIRWSTATENNNHHFEVQRSDDGQSWNTIAIVAGIGNSTQLNNYSYTDKSMQKAVAYYRIMQVDMDGKSTYTVVRSIKNADNKKGVEIFAKSRSITLMFDEMKSSVSLEICNLNGQTITRQHYQHSAYITLQMNNITAGVYVIKVTDQDNQVESKKIFLN